MFNEVIEILEEVKGNDTLYLNEPVVVRLSPHKWPFEIHGLCVSPKKELYVMDGGGQWEKLSETDPGADLLISSIFQRVKTIFLNRLNVAG